MKAPFPYFGGKASVASAIWDALGQPKHYIEPFFGSGATLLSRPDYDPKKHVETVNDADGFVANVWRALQADPDAVAKLCDWPVNHADLSARKMAMLRKKDDLLSRMISDEKFFDSEMAGYWIWAASCWIGGGLTRPCQIPHVSDGGSGVHAIGKRPHVAHGGFGVHAIGQRPHLADGGRGVQETYNENIFAWFRQLSERLRYVRVVCGDWSRVCGGTWQDAIGDVGIFFDPPYSADRLNVYDVDSFDVANAVREWSVERAEKKTYRIVIAGYDEHDILEKHGWKNLPWKTSGGYSKISRGESRGKKNRFREVLWFSPHCLKTDLFL